MNDFKDPAMQRYFNGLPAYVQAVSYTHLDVYKRQCPELVVVPPHHDRYAEYSEKVNAVYQRYTDLVEPFGIDESWLDITGSMHLFGGDGKAIADEIRATIFRETGLTCSVGVSFNKIFAKLGSDYRKPNATTAVSYTHLDVYKRQVFTICAMVEAFWPMAT